MDGAGNLYGVAWDGGTHRGGLVYELSPNQNGGWTETVLYNFCSQTNCADGQGPNTLLMDGTGNLYGTTSTGGLQSGGGVVFELMPDQSRTTWTESVLYRFCSTTQCVSEFPYALIMDGAGNLFGTTIANYTTSYSGGEVFQLLPNHDRTTWTEVVLYAFCSQINCADGRSPSGLLTDGANLYGTTSGGGNDQTNGAGVAFALSLGNALTVRETGNGGVKSSPVGIDCPTACAANFASGTQVTLTATPASGWGFTGWGGACGGTGTCTVTMNSAQSVSATFTQNLSYSLSVSVTGSPGGKVTSAPAGIDCGSTCSASFGAGTVVTLTASPAKAWGLAGWGGACSGIDSCTVTLNASTNVSASFSTLFGSVADPVVTSPSDAPALPPALIGPLPND